MARTTVEALIAADISNADYHALPSVSNTQLKDYDEDPRLYWWKYKSGKYIAQHKDCFDFGTAVHSIALSQDFSQIVQIPSEVLTKDGKRMGKAWDAFKADHEGLILLKPADFERVTQSVAAAFAHEFAGELLCSEGPVEKTYQYFDEGLQLWLRCKPDKLVTWNGKRICLDVKTTTNTCAKKFVRSVIDFGYHRQNYTYKKILAKCGENIDAFVFIAIQDDQPHTVDCYTLKPDFLAYAERDVEKNLASLSYRERNNDWSFDSEPIDLDPPNYLKYQGDYIL